MTLQRSITPAVLATIVLASFYLVACAKNATTSNPTPVTNQPNVVEVHSNTRAPLDQWSDEPSEPTTSPVSAQGGGLRLQPEPADISPTQAISIPDPAAEARATRLMPASSTAHSALSRQAPTVEPMEEPLRPAPVPQTYIVRAGDTLGAIAARVGVPVDILIQLNGIQDPNTLSVGQVIRLRVSIPAGRDHSDQIIPDSEAVYSPAYANFDLNAFVNKYNGYLVRYNENVEGELLTGPQIIQLVAERFSVGPRVLLTILEMESGWVTRTPANDSELNYPMGYASASWTGLYLQIWYAADKLNEGYYGRIYQTEPALAFSDGIRVAFSSRVNPGTAAIQNLFAHLTTFPAWQNVTGPDGFSMTYRKLFGDPFAHAIEPLVPSNERQPVFRLPWEDTHIWFFTGGPHGGWADGSAWAAVDFAPMQGGGTCTPSLEWSVAIAPGKIVQAEHGRVMENLAGSDFVGNGWSIMYMHQSPEGRVPIGARVKTGDHIGHPACEGGKAYADHLHIARLYNGQWIAAADPKLPFVMSGWQVGGAAREYDGWIKQGTHSIAACDCRTVEINGLAAAADRY